MRQRHPQWPLPVMDTPRFIIVDLANFMYMAQYEPMLHQLGNYFPMRAVITTILSFNQFVSYEEAFWRELEAKFPDIDRIDRDILEIYLEGFVLKLDEFIRQKVPYRTDTADYIIQGWLDSTTIVLKYDESVWMLRDSGTVNRRHFEEVGNTRPVRIVRVLRKRSV